VLLAILIGLVAGCGRGSHGPGVATAGGGGKGGGAKPKPSASVDAEEQRRLFTQCMRDHGVDVPDPDPNGPGVRILASGGPGSDTANKTANKMETAMKECQKYLPAGVAHKPNTQELEQMRQFAKCMRDHGVDMPDPDPNGGGFGVKKGTGQGEISPDDATFKAANEACKDKLPNGGQLHTEGDGK
jgi:hypothetical protein